LIIILVFLKFVLYKVGIGINMTRLNNHTVV
jgi:hypothetical protein